MPGCWLVCCAQTATPAICGSQRTLTQQLLVQVRLIEVLRRGIQRQEGQLRDLLLRAYPAALELFAELTTHINSSS